MEKATQVQFSTITLLRFPMIVGVVLLHCYNADPHIQNTYPVFSVVQYIFSVLIASTAVPLFFFISGFLFFNSIGRWDSKIYTDKLKKRARTLAVPYFFWISLCILIYFTAQQLPFPAPYFAGEKLIRDYSTIDFLSCYWAAPTGTGMPFLFPFWFIRDLMVAVVLSPLVFYFVKYLKFYGIALLFIIWAYVPRYREIDPACAFFFTAGAYFSINRLNIITVFKQVHYLAWLYPVISVCNIIFREYEWNGHLYGLRVVAGIIFLFIMGSRLVQKDIKLPPFLANAAFFVFAAHEPWLSLVKRLGPAVVKPNSDATFIALYFGCAAVTIAGTLVAYRILLALCPRFLSVISGGR